MSIGIYGIGIHPSHEINKYTQLVSEIMIEDNTFSYDQVSRSTYKIDIIKQVVICLLYFFYILYIHFINILFYCFRGYILFLANLIWYFMDISANKLTL